ncbi:MAG: tetratricopeptide repeat protein [Bacteroidetes bacterium]|nr:MAG: tetratricopeptide repeat protein [Bacteroidota bacterium]TAG90632.1 MAG: tetratricopeptide repeat protein [Bacteroidota bacterium]
MKKIFLCLIFIYFSHILVAQNAQDSLYTYAQALAKMKKETQALVTISKHINAYPKDAKGYFLKGSLEFKTGNALQAEADFSTAISLKKNYFEAYFNRAAVRIGMTKYGEGKNDLSYILYQNPNIPLVWHERGKLYTQLAMPDSALYDFSQALVLKPELEEAQSLSATIYFQKKEYQKAKQYALNAHKINPSNEKTLVTLSEIYFLDNQYTTAMPYFDERLRLNPYDWNGFLMRAKIYFEQKQYQKSKEDLEKIIEKEKNNPETYFYLAKIYYELKNLKEACLHLKKSIALNFNDAKKLEKKYCD